MSRVFRLSPGWQTGSKIVLPFFITTFLLIGYSMFKEVHANQVNLIAQQSIWKEFSSKEGKFKVLMPGTPTFQKSNVKTKGGTIPFNVFSVYRQREAVYLVGYGDLPRNYSVNSPEVSELLPQLPSRPNASSGIRSINRQNIRLGNIPGKEIRVQSSEGFTMRWRAYVVNKRLYQLGVLTDKEQSLTKSIDGFFNSFKLANTTSASAAPRKPSMAELNTDLKQAVCSQNWRQAVKVINQMVAIAPSPEERNQLVTYRSQLQGLANSNSRIPLESLSGCSTQQGSAK
jgi:hypothetical protein